MSIDSIRASSDVTTLSTPSEKPGSNGAPDAATESPVVLAIAVDTTPPAVIAILTLAIDILKVEFLVQPAVILLVAVVTFYLIQCS